MLIALTLSGFFCLLVWVGVAQDYHPLGEVRCSVTDCHRADGLLWISFDATVHGYSSPSRIDAWICPDHYAVMTATSAKPHIRLIPAARLVGF